MSQMDGSTDLSKIWLILAGFAHKFVISLVGQMRTGRSRISSMPHSHVQWLSGSWLGQRLWVGNMSIYLEGYTELVLIGSRGEERQTDRLRKCGDFYIIFTTFHCLMQVRRLSQTQDRLTYSTTERSWNPKSVARVPGRGRGENCCYLHKSFCHIECLVESKEDFNNQT